MAGVATFAGCGAGLIELAACISCYYSLKEYHACKEEQSAPNE
ncbi:MULTISPECIES: hypothetical protein [unclassified Sphingobacterium]|nr:MULTISPECIES: hypothetical protein [unclassified Sphingobacterium]KKX46733.1 hypothetical protein L950_0230285 [Sphingobacterium sp. IITKGP-BTPF85]MCS3556603.1 hypothetical protein [Sphingobacterium sp. JUb21]